MTQLAQHDRPVGSHRLCAEPNDLRCRGQQVAGQLEQLQEATGADELIVTTITHDHADRVHSYQLLADEWEHR